MRKFLILICFALFPAVGSSKEKKSCRDGFELISCSEVKGSKRKHFCWKGEMTNEKKNKFCKSSKLAKKKAKAIKKEMKIKKAVKKEAPIAPKEESENSEDDLGLEY